MSRHHYLAASFTVKDYGEGHRLSHRAFGGCSCGEVIGSGHERTTGGGFDLLLQPKVKHTLDFCGERQSIGSSAEEESPDFLALTVPDERQSLALTSGRLNDSVWEQCKPVHIHQSVADKVSASVYPLKSSFLTDPE